MSYTPEEIIEYIREDDVKFIRMAFRDAFGVQKNISVMPGEIGKAFTDGIEINAREIAGFEGSAHANLLLKPDPETLAVLPWRSENGKVLRMFCDVYTPDGEPIAELVDQIVLLFIDCIEYRKDSRGNKNGLFRICGAVDTYEQN